jgi:cytochrome b
MNKVRVWDLPTRVFHWALAVFITILVITGELGGSAMRWHFLAGYSVLSLLLFRFIWGFIGGLWSRFSTFLKGPKAAVRYLLHPEDSAPNVGHNPLGALSVIAMLVVLFAQVTTGMFSDDEISASGPLAKMVSSDVVNWASFYHVEIGKWALIGLIVLHIGAIFYYYFKKRENLVTPMVRGDKLLPGEVKPSRDDAVARFTALSILTICIGCVVLFVNWAG